MVFQRAVVGAKKSGYITRTQEPAVFLSLKRIRRQRIIYQSNWAVIRTDKGTEFSPLYDNGSSLCSYISDEQAKTYLGNDLLRWKSLVDTKSKSLIRRTKNDLKRPTHLEMIQFIHERYPMNTRKLVQRICDLSSDTIELIVQYGSENRLHPDKKQLICRFLNAKVEMLKQVYCG